MPGRFSGLMNALYDPKKRQFLGRDGAGWTKLGVFYFFFYLGLAGFFCAMLAVFMAVSPRDHPRYYDKSSRMATRSNPLTPGLGFRPQPDPDKNLIFIDKTAPSNEPNPNAKSLDQYLRIFYWKQNTAEEKEYYNERKSASKKSGKFDISGTKCQNDTQYGYAVGKPCVLVKMNKIVGFEPIPGTTLDDEQSHTPPCKTKANAVSIHCHGEYPADEDSIGDITYYSEDGEDKQCGSLSTDWFPYEGKVNRQDVYQAPYIWVQFLTPKPNVLINVMCRVYGQNIHFDKKSGRALTRFQIYVKDSSKAVPSRQAGDI
ncbi:unnamed protein product [Rotaria magnacalcarata]|uniref:Sodium/potassium-transporting ATPase subunit beta n=4 Tax=Rotaria magnacalcarata TaxID=392030 RepID=A0A814JJ43_9BILA|nr:unnamed protein product [Rotaria magnacalcarata]CAF1248646.1 unnamed protein product [Rotaria magnacalcarata]CAF1947611.1 unnamed protein product [Rotaria magnacalcarata]CAF4421437.1 unnamed protein product [Rotaria magnacalcarata]CAF4542529.1 unnamed protein product [Rotaria magnacalcarata]